MDKPLVETTVEACPAMRLKSPQLLVARIFLLLSPLSSKWAKYQPVGEIHLGVVWLVNANIYVVLLTDERGGVSDSKPPKI